MMIVMSIVNVTVTSSGIIIITTTTSTNMWAAVSLCGRGIQHHVCIKFGLYPTLNPTELGVGFGVGFG